MSETEIIESVVDETPAVVEAPQPTEEKPTEPTIEGIWIEDIVIWETELEDIFKSLFPENQEVEEDPFHAEKKEDDNIDFESVANETQQKLEQEIAEKSKVSEEFETYKTSKEEELTTIKSELESAKQKISEQEKTLNEANELWWKIISDPILEQLVKKKINGEDITLAPAVQKEILDEIEALEWTIEASSTPKPTAPQESYESRLQKANKDISRV